MSKISKLRDKFWTMSKTLTFDELVTVMQSYGYKWICSGGSHGMFFNELTKHKIKPAVRPHGSGEPYVNVRYLRNTYIPALELKNIHKDDSND